MGKVLEEARYPGECLQGDTLVASAQGGGSRMACRAGLLTRSLTRIPRAARRRGPCVRPHVLSLPCLPLPRFAVAFTESMKVAAGLQWVRVCVRCAPVSAVAGTWRGLGPERLLRGDRQRPHAHRRSRPVSGSAPHAARGGGVRSCCCSRNSASVWWFWRGTRSAGAASSHAPLRSDERVGRGGGGPLPAGGQLRPRSVRAFPAGCLSEAL